MRDLKKNMGKWILLLLIGLISFNANAFGDDEKKDDKKIIHLKLDNKKSNKGNKSNKIDTLLNKKYVDDTLTFDEKNHKDDTLIFADDELSISGGPNPELKNKEVFVKQGSKSITITPIIYPNPSNGIRFIELINGNNSETEIIIISLNGSVCKHIKTYENIYEINDLASGTYIIQIKNNNQVVQKKFFVK